MAIKRLNIGLDSSPKVLTLIEKKSPPLAGFFMVNRSLKALEEQFHSAVHNSFSKFCLTHFLGKVQTLFGVVRIIDELDFCAVTYGYFLMKDSRASASAS